MVSTLESFDNETRKYTEVTGEPVDDAIKVMTMKKLILDKIRDMLQTADLTSYQECKDYAIKQARVIKNNRASSEPAPCGPALDSALKENSTAQPTTPAKETRVYTPQEEEEWLMFTTGRGKGKKGKGPKGHCFKCGEHGHVA